MVKQYNAENSDDSRITALEAQINSLKSRFEMLLDVVEAFPQVQSDVHDLKQFEKTLKDVFYEAMY